MPKKDYHIHKRKVSKCTYAYTIGSANRPVDRKSNAHVFSEVLAAWQISNRIRLKEASISRYQNIIDTQILPDLGDKRVDFITPAVINQFLAAKLKNGRLDHGGGLSASYVRSIALIISAAITYGAAENMCNPLQSAITKPAPRKKELTIVEVDKQSILENELMTNMDETKLLIYITLYTGIRIGEACALMWEDIDMNAHLLHVRRTISRVWFTADGKKKSKLTIESPKSKESLRCIPICSRLYSVLSHFSFKKLDGYILKNSTENCFVSPRTFEYRYKAILKKCALASYNYHALRHTFATRCVERGVDIKSLSEILGHSDVSITLDTYVHSSIEMKRLQLEKLLI